MSKPPLGIRVLDAVVPDCDSICEFLASRTMQDSRVDGGKLNSARQSKTAFVPMLSWQNPECVHEMNRAVWTAMDRYAEEWGFGFSSIESVSIQKYEIGDYYAPHVDTGPSCSRIVSAVAYLNTVDEGGETYFNHFDYGVSPVEGRVVIFPSNYIYRHEAKPPVSGHKIAAAFWAVP